MYIIGAMFSPSKSNPRYMYDERVWFWAGLINTSKHLDSHHSHIKEISALKVCWPDMPKYTGGGENTKVVELAGMSTWSSPPPHPPD